VTRSWRRGGPRPNLLNGNIWSVVANGELRPQRTPEPGSYIPDRPPPADTWVWRETRLGVMEGFPPASTLEGFVAETYQRLDEINKRLVENNNRLLRLERELGIAGFIPHRKEST
jgi:hypothetical protein